MSEHSQCKDIEGPPRPYPQFLMPKRIKIVKEMLARNL